MTGLAKTFIIALIAVALGMTARYYHSQSPLLSDDPMLNVIARPIMPAEAPALTVVTAGGWNVVVFLSGAECPPCVEFVADVLNQAAQRPVSVKAVFVNSSRAEALQTVNWLQWRKTALWDADGSLAQAFHAKLRLPHVAVWNPQRKLVYETGPVFTSAEKSSHLQAILAMLPKPR